MKILELFSGTECLSNAFRARGHECFTVDWDTRFPSSLHIDIMQLTARRILTEFGQPDIIWAGCDCTTFSVAAIGHHRRRDPATGSLAPKTERAARVDQVNRHTLRIIRSLRPRFFFIENPMGGLRKMDYMRGTSAPPDNLLSVRLHLPPGPPTSGRTTRSPSSCRRAGTATPAIFELSRQTGLRRKPKGRLSESRRKPRFQYAEREDFRPTGQRAKDNEHELNELTRIYDKRSIQH